MKKGGRNAGGGLYSQANGGGSALPLTKSKKLGASSQYSCIYDDDDFEEQYIVQGPKTPIRSGNVNKSALGQENNAQRRILEVQGSGRSASMMTQAQKSVSLVETQYADGPAEQNKSSGQKNSLASGKVVPVSSYFKQGNASHHQVNVDKHHQNSDAIINMRKDREVLLNQNQKNQNTKTLPIGNIYRTPAVSGCSAMVRPPKYQFSNNGQRENLVLSPQKQTQQAHNQLNLMGKNAKNNIVLVHQYQQKLHLQQSHLSQMNQQENLSNQLFNSHDNTATAAIPVKIKEEKQEEQQLPQIVPQKTVATLQDVNFQQNSATSPGQLYQSFVQRQQQQIDKNKRSEQMAVLDPQSRLSTKPSQTGTSQNTITAKKTILINSDNLTNHQVNNRRSVQSNYNQQHSQQKKKMQSHLSPHKTLMQNMSHLKQNAMKFFSSENDYANFLSSNGRLITASSLITSSNTTTGSGKFTIDQYKKQQIIQTARSKMQKSRQAALKSSDRTSALSSINGKPETSQTNQEDQQQQLESPQTAQDNDSFRQNMPAAIHEETKNGNILLTSAPHFSRTAANPASVLSENSKKTSIGKKKVVLPGTGLSHKFMNFENKLIRYILEKQGFKESVQDYGMPAAEFYNIANASNSNFLNSNSVVLIWSSSVVKSNIYSSLGRFQKINHFPRSYEITRKDCLYERYSRMQALYGNKNFNFMPSSYNCPQQNQQLQNEMRRNTKQLWIMKPKASSQGKGIQVISSFEEVPRGAGQSSCLVQQYIHNPLLIDGYKWDLRIYVAVTSINPLRIYVYEEGLARFASEKYDTKDLKNIFSHLTNYSINKKHKSAYKDPAAAYTTKPSTSTYTQKYQNNSGKATSLIKQQQQIQPATSQGVTSTKLLTTVESGPQNPFFRNSGNQHLDQKYMDFESRSNVTQSKWTLRAFREYLKNLVETSDPKDIKGLNIESLFKKINDIVVKTIISVEPLLWNGVEMYLPNTYQFDTSSQIDTKKKNNNCFELLGFDILVDEHYKPWLLEVNLSPSLNTDTQLDFKVKGSLMADLFSLIGIQNEEMQQNMKVQAAEMNGNGANVGSGFKNQGGIPSSATSSSNQQRGFGHSENNDNKVGFGKGLSDINGGSNQNCNSGSSQNFKNGGIVKRTFLPKVIKQKLNSFGQGGQKKDSKRCPFPLRPSTKAERSDYAMIEESVLENERRGNFTRVYPSEHHLHLYRNFFEEERRNDNILHNYIFNNKYKNMTVVDDSTVISPMQNAQFYGKHRDSSYAPRVNKYLAAEESNPTQASSKTAMRRDQQFFQHQNEAKIISSQFTVGKGLVNNQTNSVQQQHGGGVSEPRQVPRGAGYQF